MADALDKAESTNKKLKLIFPAVSFWIGAAIMAFELVGARLLTPFFGAGIQVWTIVITITLASLAFGYWLGGVIIDFRPSVMTLAVILFLSALLLVFAHIFGSSIPALFEKMSPIAGAACSAFSILFFPLLFLGMVQPVLARLMICNTVRAGAVVGRLMAAGTSGGIIGTAATGLFFMPSLGLSKTLLIIAAGTFIAAVVVLIYLRKWIIGVAIIIVALLSIAKWEYLIFETKPPGKAKVLEKVESLYGHLEVLESNGNLALTCNGIFQTVLPSLTFGIEKGTLIRGHDYFELLPYFCPDAGKSLQIGVGAGLYSRMLSLYGIDSKGVEIDKSIIKLAEKYFSLTGDIHIADGRAFLIHDPERYDIIILDTFLGGNAPEHLYTLEFFELISKHLVPSGIFAVRLIGNPEHPAIQAVARTIKEVFPFIKSVQSGIANELQNVFIFAGMNDFELNTACRIKLREYGFTGDEFCQINTEDADLLTDDKTNLTLLNSDIVSAHRNNSLKIREILW